MNSTPATVLVQASELGEIATHLLVAAGLPTGDAASASEAIVAADLRGVDTHGVRFVPIYVRCVRKGLINPTPSITIEQCGPTLLRADGDNGEGHVVARRVLDRAIEVANEHGACTALVRDTNHVGMLAYYVERAAEHGLVAHAVTNGEPWMAPWGGIDRVLSTNPMAWAFPTAARPTVVLDMATSVVAMSKVVIAAKDGERIPLGWALDRNGVPTDDPEEVMSHGSILPLGDYKGSGLSLVVDLMAGVLSGGLFSTDLRDLGEDRPQGVCCFFSLLDPARFLDAADFRSRVDEDIDRVKAVRTVEGVSRVLVPGELEAETRKRRLREGIPVPVDEAQRLNDTARELGQPELFDLTKALEDKGANNGGAGA